MVVQFFALFFVSYNHLRMTKLRKSGWLDLIWVIQAQLDFLDGLHH